MYYTSFNGAAGTLWSKDMNSDGKDVWLGIEMAEDV